MMNAKDFLNFVFNEKHLFINIKDNYNDAMIGQVMKLTDNTVEIWWYSLNILIPPKGVTFHQVTNFYSEVTPFLIVDRNRIFIEKEDIELQKKLSNWYIVINRIYESPHNCLRIEDCIKLVSETIEITPEVASAVVKVFLARNKLLFKTTKSGDYICLSAEMQDFENKKRYLSSISDEINAQSNRINYVISHGQTVGNYRETLFISVLKKYIPSKFHVATGFIEGSSKQIDIIIYDRHNYLPVFREGDLVVVKKEAVVAVIEIKTTLNQNTLKDSLEGIERISHAGMNSVPFFKGIFSFSSTLSNETLANNITRFYRENEITTIHEHLDVVCVPKMNSLYIDYNNLNSDEPTCPTLFEVEDIKGINIGESVFFQKLFSFLEVEKSAKKINRRYFEELISMAKFNSINVLTDDDWLPLHTFISDIEKTSDLNPETEFDKIMKINISNVKNRVKDVMRWIEGEISREELIENYNNFN